MAAPFLPQVIVNTDFVQSSSAQIQPLQACIVGPHAQLVRYAQPTEKSLGALGAYVSTDDTAYSWPHLSTGGLVDLSYAKLFADEAKCVFYSEMQGTGLTVAPVSGKPNRISISGTQGFALNGAHARLTGLYSRDVRPGDRVRVSGVSGGKTYMLDSYVTGLTGPNDAAAVSSATADTANKATQSASTQTQQIGGTTNNWSVTPDATSYNGLVDGYINEIYTVTVLQGSTGSDPTTAILKIKSASGLDDVASFVPAASSTAKAAGTRGLTLAFSTTGGDDLMAGQSWQITVAEAFTATSATSGGAYNGATDDTYVITVTRGGMIGESNAAKQAQITITTVKGLDASGPTTVTSVSSAFVIGTQSVTITFDAGTTGLCKGDRFYIPVTAAKVGLMNTLVLANSLPTQLQSATDLNLWLYTQKSVQVPVARAGYDPLVNYSAAASGITVKQGMVLYDAGFTDSSGAMLPLTVIEASLFVEYRAYLPDLAGNVSSLTDIGNIDGAVSGATDPDNPLKWALSKALIGNAGTPVLFIAVANPSDSTSWTAAINKLVGREDVYNIVPLTYDPAIINLFVAHVTSQSGPTVGHERALFIGLKPTTSKLVVGQATSSDGALTLATLADDPSASGTQYTLLSVPADNADFITNNVRKGDEVRFNYTTSFGQLAYSSFTVASVLSESQLLLASGPAMGVTQAQRMEIWHTLSSDEIVTDLEAQAGAFSNRRVCAVWSDLIGLSPMATETYYMAAAQAGLISGSLPHQGMTNVALDGFADVVSAHGLFNSTEIATLAGNGVWMISRTPGVQSNAVICRLGCTTDVSTLGNREEMVRRNVDSITRYLRDRFAPYLGVSNVTPSMEAVLRVEVDAAHSYLKASGYTSQLGGQLIDASNVSVAPSPSLPDRFVVAATWEVPAPLNTIEYDATIIVGYTG